MPFEKTFCYAVAMKNFGLPWKW